MSTENESLHTQRGDKLIAINADRTRSGRRRKPTSHNSSVEHEILPHEDTAGQGSRGGWTAAHNREAPAGGWSGARDGEHQNNTLERGKRAMCLGWEGLTSMGTAGSCVSIISLSRVRISTRVVVSFSPEALRGLLATHGRPQVEARHGFQSLPRRHLPIHLLVLVSVSSIYPLSSHPSEHGVAALFHWCSRLRVPLISGVLAAPFDGNGRRNFCALLFARRRNQTARVRRIFGTCDEHRRGVVTGTRLLATVPADNLHKRAFGSWKSSWKSRLAIFIIVCVACFGAVPKSSQSRSQSVSASHGGTIFKYFQRRFQFFRRNDTFFAAPRAGSFDHWSGLLRTTWSERSEEGMLSCSHRVPSRSFSLYGSVLSRRAVLSRENLGTAAARQGVNNSKNVERYREPRLPLWTSVKRSCAGPLCIKGEIMYREIHQFWR